MRRALREPLLDAAPASEKAASRITRPVVFAALGILLVFSAVLSAQRYVLTFKSSLSAAVPTYDLIAIWETAEDGNRLEQIHPRSVAATSDAQVTFTIWPEDERQRIIGFGAALTQASNSVWRRLGPMLRRQVLELFFGDEGLRASLARVPINSCDFASSSYSLDDTDGDFELDHFDETLRDDEAHLLPLVRAALSVSSSRLQLLASPWSPPAWMKSNGNMNGNGAPRGLRPEAAAAWARYISKWLGAWAAHNASVAWLTVQNEPLAPSPWEACYYTASQERSFIAEHLGPTLAAATASGLHPPVSLLGFDDQKDHVVQWAAALLDESSSPAAAHTAGLAYHWYAGDHFDKLAAAVEAHPNKVFLGTEATYELTRLSAAVTHDEWVREGVWARGEGYGHAILGDLLAGSSGWIDWNLLLDSTGGPNHLGNTCDAPMIADATYGHVHVHPQFYYLGHFSRFVPPESRVVRTERAGTEEEDAATPPADAPGGVYNLSGTVAYGACPAGVRAVSLVRPDRRLVVIVLNCGDAPAIVQLDLGQSGGGAGGVPLVQHTIPAHAIQTYVLAERPQRQEGGLDREAAGS